MRSIEKTYNIYDGTIGIWREHVNDEVRAQYDEIRMMMMNDGFTFHQDARIKKHYRLITDNHHRGHRRDVYFKSSVVGRHIEFNFYENTTRDNAYGGEYTQNKMKVMPYMTRLGIQRILNKIVASLDGYEDHSKTYPESGLDAIMKHRQELEDFQGSNFYERERQSYNCTDADNVEMYDGDLRYFWDYTGSLERGTVYRNINNMWWVHTGPYSYRNVTSFQLFTWKPGMGSRRKLNPEEIDEKIRTRLQEAVKNENFERAIVLRDLIGKQAA